jgi:hypothetical protein
MRLDRRIQLFIIILDPAIKSQDDCPNKRLISKNVIAGISEAFSRDCFVAGAPWPAGYSQPCQGCGQASQ